MRCDFLSIADVDAPRERIRAGSSGRIDILVDDAWGGDPFVDFTTPYWEADLQTALNVVRNALDTHLTALHRLLPLVIARPGGLVVEVTDGDTDAYTGAGLPYFLSKSGIRAIGRMLGAELARYGCTGLAVTPGFLRSEAMLDHFGVSEHNWQERRRHHRAPGLRHLGNPPLPRPRGHGAGHRPGRIAVCRADPRLMDPHARIRLHRH